MRDEALVNEAQCSLVVVGIIFGMSGSSGKGHRRKFEEVLVSCPCTVAGMESIRTCRVVFCASSPFGPYDPHEVYNKPCRDVGWNT